MKKGIKSHRHFISKQNHKIMPISDTNQFIDQQLRQEIKKNITHKIKLDMIF